MIVARYPKHPFTPKLRLRKTGYCPAGQWCGVMFKDYVEVGLSTIFEHPTVAQSTAHYLSELRRCGHKEVT